MTAAAAARLILHRAAQVRTLADLFRIGDRLGVPRDETTTLAVYQARVARRLAEMHRLAYTAPYQAGRYPVFRN